MITKLLNEVNENIKTLNNLVQDKEYFEKLDERIEKVNNYVQEQKQEIERLNNIINKIEEHFVFLKMNSTGGNKEFFEDILDFIKALRELKGSESNE